MRYKVSWIDTPDGRVLDTTTEDALGVIRSIASRLPMVGEDQLLVIEPVSVDEAIRDKQRTPDQEDEAQDRYWTAEAERQRVTGVRARFGDGIG